MKTEKFKIIPYTNKYRKQILNIWEKSVLATHDFLSENDFNEIKQLVSNMDFNDLKVYCIINKSSIGGFIGVYENKVEMLFLSPEYFGQGLGFKLLDFTVKELN